MSKESMQTIVGELSRQTLPMKSFKWKIGNYFGFSQEVNHYIESPQFSFMDSKWHLRIFPGGHENNRGWIALYLIKDDSVIEEHNVTYILGIEKKDGSDHDSFKYKSSFKRYKKSNAYNFRSDFINESLIAPQGTVAFFCTVIANVRENPAAASQIIYPQACDHSESTLGKISTKTEELSSKNSKHARVATAVSPGGFERFFQDFESLLRAEEDSDVVLKVNSKEFKAHKTILRARSPVFKSMFRHDMQEKICSVVDIPDCDPVAFQNFLLYLYCSKLEEFPSSKVFDLYHVADKYDVPELKTKCLDLMEDNVSLDTFCNVLRFALLHNEPALLKCATSFFIGNETDIIVTAEWLSFLKENPVEANELHIKASRIRM